jgi:hypothetical protein
VTAKPAVSGLGIDLAAQVWHRSGRGGGAIEVAFVQASGTHSTTSTTSADVPEWVLMRVADDPEHRVLVFDRHEWECFLDGARNGEFDDAATSRNSGSPSTLICESQLGYRVKARQGSCQGGTPK